MGALLVLAATFVLLWVIFILPQQRRVRGHQALVTSLEPGDDVVLTAGIYGHIVDLGPEDMTVEVAPGVQLRVARQAVLRRVEDVTGDDRPLIAGESAPADTSGAALGAGATGEPTTAPPGPPPTDAPAGEAAPDTDDRGPATPGTPL